jgi:hypothetical protein
MREVYENRAAAEETGRRGRDDIVRLLSPDVVGRRMKTRLLQISEERGFPGPRVTAGSAS